MIDNYSFPGFSHAQAPKAGDQGSQGSCGQGSKGDSVYQSCQRHIGWLAVCCFFFFLGAVAGKIQSEPKRCEPRLRE